MNKSCKKTIELKNHLNYTYKMFFIRVHPTFNNEADIDVRLALRQSMSAQKYNELLSFKERLAKREARKNITVYSAHVVDWAIMHAKGHQDFHDIAKKMGGKNTNVLMQMISKILLDCHRFSSESLIKVAEQQVLAEKKDSVLRRITRKTSL